MVNPRVNRVIPDVAAVKGHPITVSCAEKGSFSRATNVCPNVTLPTWSCRVCRTFVLPVEEVSTRLITTFGTKHQKGDAGVGGWGVLVRFFSSHSICIAIMFFTLIGMLVLTFTTCKNFS